MTWNPVPITNDQMFKHVFGRNEELCHRLVELALDEPIEAVEFLETNHESREVSRPGGAYLDVLARTTAGEFIDVEMQAARRPGLLQRARLYSARLTEEAWTDHIERSDAFDYDYSNLPRVAVVFICDFDPFKAGRRRYTGRTMYNDVVFNDGAVVVFLNARGVDGDVEPDLAAFLDYVASGRAELGRSSFVDGVSRAVAAANKDSQFLEGLMDINEKLWISRQEGLAEGEAERQRQIAELATRMAAEGRQDALVATLTDANLLEEELRRYGIA